MTTKAPSRSADSSSSTFTHQDLVMVGKRLLTEARWRDGTGTGDETEAAPAPDSDATAPPAPPLRSETSQEAAIRRDLYYYLLGREHIMPPEWRGARERSDLEQQPEYALYKQLRARFRVIDADAPVFAPPKVPNPGKEHAALQKAGVRRTAWLEPPGPIDDSEMGKRVRATKLKAQREAKKRKRAASGNDDDNNSSSSSDEHWPGPSGTRGRQSFRLVQALRQHREAPPVKRSRIMTLRDLPPPTTTTTTNDTNTDPDPADNGNATMLVGSQAVRPPTPTPTPTATSSTSTRVTLQFPRRAGLRARSKVASMLDYRSD